MEYRVAPSPGSAALAAPTPMPVPLMLRPAVKLEDTGGELAWKRTF